MLDIDKIQKLYDFGGLMAYRVKYFCPTAFKVINMDATFNKDVAERKLKELENNGYTAGIEQILVKFDGAFSIHAK